MVGSISYFLIFFYFTTKAGMYLDDRDKTLFFLKIFGLCCFVIFLITFIVQLVFLKNEDTKED